MPSHTVSEAELGTFSTGVLTASGLPDRHAEAVASHMMWADTHGRPNYGVWRLPLLIRRAEADLFATSEPSVDRRSPSLAIVDARNVIGHYGATIASDLAIEMARESGLAVVGVRHSNFMGALGYYADRIAHNGMVAFVASNSYPRVAAHGGTSAVLGTNPLAFAAPLLDGTSVVLDMATSTTAGGFVTKAAEQGELLPEGVAITPDGSPLTDPKGISEGAMLPLGGAKGFGLGLMVEILAGVLTGAGISHGVKSQYKDFENPGDSGHFLVATDISTWMDTETYHARMDELVSAVKASSGVRLPGEERFDARRRSNERGAVELDEKTVAALEELAARYGMDPPWANVGSLAKGGSKEWKGGSRE